uniref:Gp15 n=1 Tax=Edwardsiella phage eiMSLS TaxID=945085 RepID=E7EL16_9VIRU|nr:gp15 [Edwardsiella phage eiMSLS]
MHCNGNRAILRPPHGGFLLRGLRTMSKSPFKLNPAPTFPATVMVPIAGQDKPVPLDVVFRHYPVDEYQRNMADTYEALQDPDKDAYAVMAESLLYLLADWRVDGGDPLNKENALLLVKNFPRAYGEITKEYTTTLQCLREKN